jgi:hypothetical protein
MGVPTKIHAPTQVRLDHQFKDWEKRPYVHPPEFDIEYERLSRLQADQRRTLSRPPHDDWKGK